MSDTTTSRGLELARIDEGSEDGTPAIFTITRSGDSFGDMDVYFTVSGSATPGFVQPDGSVLPEGADYTFDSFSNVEPVAEYPGLYKMTLGHWQRYGWVSLFALNDDDDNEPTETIEITLVADPTVAPGTPPPYADPTGNPATHPATAQAKIMEGINLRIDSNNDGQITDADDLIEDDPDKPGKIIAVNDGDFDADGIPDYADGFNADEKYLGGTVSDKDDRLEGRAFAPMSLKLPDWVNPQIAKLRIWYDDSPPPAVSRTGSGTSEDPYIYTPGPGTLRVWTKDASDARNGDAISEGGDWWQDGGGLPR